MVLRFARVVLLSGFAILILVPLLLVVFTSMKSNIQFYADPLGLPPALQAGNFRELFTGQPLLTYFGNSVLVTVSAVLLELVL